MQRSLTQDALSSIALPPLRTSASASSAPFSLKQASVLHVGAVTLRTVVVEQLDKHNKRLSLILRLEHLASGGAKSKVNSRSHVLL